MAYEFCLVPDINKKHADAKDIENIKAIAKAYISGEVIHIGTPEFHGVIQGTLGSIIGGFPGYPTESRSIYHYGLFWELAQTDSYVAELIEERSRADTVFRVRQVLYQSNQEKSSETPCHF